MFSVWLSWRALSMGLWLLAALAFVIMFVLVTIESVASEINVIKKSGEFDENAPTGMCYTPSPCSKPFSDWRIKQGYDTYLYGGV
jgi:hypothetical protein